MWVGVDQVVVVTPGVLVQQRTQGRAFVGRIENLKKVVSLKTSELYLSIKFQKLSKIIKHFA
jgi:hypothetical protein